MKGGRGAGTRARTGALGQDWDTELPHVRKGCFPSCEEEESRMLEHRKAIQQQADSIVKSLIEHRKNWVIIFEPRHRSCLDRQNLDRDPCTSKHQGRFLAVGVGTYCPLRTAGKPYRKKAKEAQPRQTKAEGALIIGVRHLVTKMVDSHAGGQQVQPACEQQGRASRQRR